MLKQIGHFFIWSEIKHLKQTIKKYIIEFVSFKIFAKYNSQNFENKIWRETINGIKFKKLENKKLRKNSKSIQLKKCDKIGNKYKKIKETLYHLSAAVFIRYIHS